MAAQRKLRIFLCHASQDKPAVRKLYQQLQTETWLDPWLDEEKLLPGQDWDIEIEKAVESADIVLICVSNSSVTREGYIQKELRFALSVALTKPDDAIFIIPVRLDNCPVPRRLSSWQYVDYFPQEKIDRAYDRLTTSLKIRANYLAAHAPDHGISTWPGDNGSSGNIYPSSEPSIKEEELPSVLDILEIGGIQFVKIPKGEFLMGNMLSDEYAKKDETPRRKVDIPYDYWIGRFPVTNSQFAEYISWSHARFNWLENWKTKLDHPVVKIYWKDVLMYINWLKEEYKDRLPAGYVFRLPTEDEWEKAARGTDGRRWAWGNEFSVSNCNSAEAGLLDTTAVGVFSPQGDSPYGLSDVCGNVWEWVVENHEKIDSSSSTLAAIGEVVDNFSSIRESKYLFRGGSFMDEKDKVRVAHRAFSVKSSFYFIKITDFPHPNTRGIRLSITPVHE